MSEKGEIVQSEKQLTENELSDFPFKQDEALLKHTPDVINAVSNMGEVGSKSQDKVYSTIDKAIDVFSEQLKDDNLTEETRDKLNDRIERMVDKSFQKDSEFKRWMGASIVAGVSGAALALAKNPEARKTLINLLTKKG
ncbi:hypothetical protein [Exiguobacterium sp. SH0S2]|uniref:hypothetical protein n=1 Tax=Exiguobacterium sp. SH0S2 TaxID=2510950 RepID=UPI00103DA4D4|nr:hypothetical protein [Exiguobacterium sp. SH0S2]TCI59357.1 hypothetical protein EVJ21_13535 [Exiguobacterium sp. SH0S2]